MDKEQMQGYIKDQADLLVKLNNELISSENRIALIGEIRLNSITIADLMQMANEIAKEPVFPFAAKRD